jgi:hypothetical protein
VKIGKLFETKIAEKIEPVIKVGERGDANKLAGEVSSYVVTPMIEQYLDDMLEHFTDTFRNDTTEIGIWISGYFGSGKSHFAKILSLLTCNPDLVGNTAAKRFEARLPEDAPRRTSIIRSLSRMDECDTDVLAFNLNTIADSKRTPLPALLLSQYYLSRGYSSNLIYARVIEAELDKQGRLEDLHRAVEEKAGKPWGEIQKNLSFYRSHLYAAACEVAEVFKSPEDVDRALAEAQKGELHNVSFLVDTILADLKQKETESKKEQRLLLVLDESGQWIEDDAGRLSQLQALVEEAAIKGQGRIWLIVTTHGDMGSVFKEARALQGDMKKIEGRFRFKSALTTENIELVLEDRLFRKKVAGRKAIEDLFESRGSGLIRGLGELANVTSRTLPTCDRERFATYYPFFPWQVHLIPDIVKALRSKGGRGEQMSGSTRTLLAITQDILRSGRRAYLEEGLGTLVTFDELYNNLAGEGEVSPDVRDELRKIGKNVPGRIELVPGATELTRRVAEVLFLIRELNFIPRTKDNIARLLIESVDDDLTVVLSKIEPELDRLKKSNLVARTGDEWEFLTGERRTFEEEVNSIEFDLKQQDLERGLRENFVADKGKNHWRNWLDSNVVAFHDVEFSVRIDIDDLAVPSAKGDVALKLYTPLSFGRVNLADLENASLREDEQATIFFLSGRVNVFEQDLKRYLAMSEIINNWKGDPNKSEDAHNLAQDREADDLEKLQRRVTASLKEGLRTGRLIFRGASRPVGVKKGQTSGRALRDDMASYWPTLYPKFDRVPVRITHEQKAIQDVLGGETTSTKDVNSLKLFDKAGKIDIHCPLLDAIKIHLATEQNAKRRVLGSNLHDKLCGIGYGWDPNAVRVGVAALVRAGVVKVVIGQKEFSNPSDRDLIDALRESRKFLKAELILEESDINPDVLTDVRKFVMKLAKKRGIDETPAALSEAAGLLGQAVLDESAEVRNWASGASLPLPVAFTDGEDTWRQVLELTNPVHRVNEVHAQQETLRTGHEAIEVHAAFHAKNSVPFKELTELVRDLEAIEPHLNSDCEIAGLLNEYRSAKAAASLAEGTVWNALQAKKNQASLELTPLLDSWRNEARDVVQQALDRLPDDLQERGLDAELKNSLSTPLTVLCDSLDGETVPVRVAAFPGRARDLVRELGQTLVHEQKKNQPPPDPGKPDEPKPKTRKVERLRVTDVASVTIVTDTEQWDALRDKLDQRVRQLLDNGSDVEIG